MLLYRRSAPVLFRSGRQFYGALRRTRWLTSAREEAGAPSLTGGSMTAAPSRLTGALLALLATTSLPALAAQVSDQDLLKDAETPDNVLTYGMGYKAQRYSPLDKINKDTVKSLVPAFAFSFGGEKQRGQEASRSSRTARSTSPARTRRMFAIDSQTGTRSGSTTPACPRASCPAATSSTGVPRSTATRSTSARSTPSSSRSTRRPARSSGTRRSRTIKDGYSIHRRPADRQGQGDRRQLGRRVRHRRPRSRPATPIPASWSGTRPTVEGNVGTPERQGRRP